MGILIFPDPRTELSVSKLLRKDDDDLSVEKNEYEKNKFK